MKKFSMAIMLLVFSIGLIACDLDEQDLSEPMLDSTDEIVMPTPIEKSKFQREENQFITHKNDIMHIQRHNQKELSDSFEVDGLTHSVNLVSLMKVIEVYDSGSKKLMEGYGFVEGEEFNMIDVEYSVTNDVGVDINISNPIGAIILDNGDVMFSMESSILDTKVSDILLRDGESFNSNVTLKTSSDVSKIKYLDLIISDILDDNGAVLIEGSYVRVEF